MKAKLSRRELLKLSGMTMGAAALGMYVPGKVSADTAATTAGGSANRNNYFKQFKPFFPGREPLGKTEMRITLMGTSCIPRLSQAAVCALVELGNGDHFMFDAGTGVTPKFYAMGQNMSMMDKIFLAHLHADHMGELPFIHGFGPYFGRSTPLYVWGPGRSNFVYTDPEKNTRGPFNDGLNDIVTALKAFDVWHVESQSFIPSGYGGYDPNQEWVPEAYRDVRDPYEIAPTELDWTKTGFVDGSGTSVPGPGRGITAVDDNIAYQHNGVKITHFPAIHTRAGSMSYKLEWNGRSMIYCGDTIPNYYMVNQARNGVDVLIHEIVMPASVWNEKMGIPASQDVWAQEVQDSSHTPQKALGYILSQLATPPRMAVGTHFQAEDDTIKSALHDIRLWYRGPVVIASDFMVINVMDRKVDVRRGIVSDFAWPQNTPSPYSDPLYPKYWTWTDATHTQVTGDPTAQLDPTEYAQVIPKELYNAR